MFAQLLTMKARSGTKAELLEHIHRWANGPGKRMSGCDKLQILECIGEPDKLAIIVYFSSKEALVHFSADEESLAMFGMAKPLVQEYHDSMEASLLEHSLA